LILLGNSRNFPFTAFYLERQNFRYRIEREKIVDTERPDHSGIDEELHLKGTFRGIINRVHLAEHDIWITAVLSNHGRLMGAVGKLLTNENDMNDAKTKVFSDVMQEDGKFPDRFEVPIQGDFNPDESDADAKKNPNLRRVVFVA